MNKNRVQTSKKSKTFIKQKLNNQNNNKPQKVSVGASIGTIIRTKPPVYSRQNFSDGRVLITHREYVAEINGSTTYAVTSYPINPGIATTFYWLAQAPAFGYESYMFHSFKACFESECSTATSGTVMLTIDYDAADASPTSKAQFMSYHNAVRTNSWLDVTYVGDNQDLQKFGRQRYIRYGPLDTNLDIKTYDVGNLLVGTQGMGGTSQVGELYVEYAVMLHTPQINLQTIISSYSRTITSGGATIARTTPFGTIPTYIGNLPITATAGTATFQRVGTYMMLYEINGTVITYVTPTFTGTATASLLTTGQGIENAGATLGCAGIYINVVSEGQTLIVDLTPSCASAGFVSFIARFALFSST